VQNNCRTLRRCWTLCRGRCWSWRRTIPIHSSSTSRQNSLWAKSRFVRSSPALHRAVCVVSLPTGPRRVQTLQTTLHWLFPLLTEGVFVQTSSYVERKDLELCHAKIELVRRQLLHIHRAAAASASSVLQHSSSTASSASMLPLAAASAGTVVSPRTARPAT
jgi:hypothetical protein